MIKILLLIALIAASLEAHADSAPASRIRTPHVTAELLAENAAVVPGVPFALGLRLDHIRNWHTYWRNPGDSGSPTSIKWWLPEGFSAGEIQWPYPKRIPVGPLTNFGYEGQVLLIVDIEPPDRIAADSVTIEASANWLVCHDICIPESARFALTLPVSPAATAPPAGNAEFARARALHPVAAEGWEFSARAAGHRAVLQVTPPPGAPVLHELFYFPYAEGKIEPSARQKLVRHARGYTLAVAGAQQPVVPFDRVHGILVSAQGFDAGGHMAMAVDVAVEGSVTAPTAAALEADVADSAHSLSTSASIGHSAWMQFPIALAFAFAGGVLLNLMPCVFPILSIKVLRIVQHDTAAQARREGLAYAFGVIGSFMLLAAVLFGLRSVGEQLGWGFQLQSPVFVACLALLFFVLGLNLSGAFDFGSLFPAWLAALRFRNRNVNAALTGLLAVFAASPCTAPFMGAALGYALAQPLAVAGFAVFAALGAGMAAPMVVLTGLPQARRWLPRPGLWMERLKQLLAFPLYATVIWLAWVLGQQSGLSAVIALLGAALLTAIGAWSLSAARSARRPQLYRVGSAICLLAALALAVQPGVPARGVQAQMPNAIWQPWSEAGVVAALAQDKPVFVDFTAAWCITCQVNKRLVLDREEVMRAFDDHGVTLLRADWTRQDPAITGALERLERKGVPVYVLYRPNEPPKLLPEILTKEVVLDALRPLSDRCH